MTVRAGPKAAASNRRLPGSEDVADWLERWARVPRGKGAGGPLVLRSWQREIVDMLHDPETLIALWLAARGNAKSGTAGALGIHHILAGDELGRTCAIVSTDERASLRLLGWVRKLVERSPSLDKRVQIYADRIIVPRTGSELLSLPAEARRIEGGDFSLLIVDEIGLVERDVYESSLLSLKRAGSRALLLGTPSPYEWQDRSPLADLLADAVTGRDRSLRAIVHTSDASHPIDCEHCILAANPGVDDLLDRAQIVASRPPRTREAEYRRARLGQWPTGVGAERFLPPGAWAACTDVARSIADGTEVVLALDGSYRLDATAVVVVTVEERPHVEVVGLWEAPDDDVDWRVSMAEVEAAILSAAGRWQVIELTADPFRWARSLEVIAAAGVPTTEFPQSAARMGPATSALRDRVLAADMSHDGDSRLAQHMANAVLRDDSRGVRLSKASKHSRRRIDLAVSAVMGVARATWHAGHRPEPKRKRVYAW